jgi:ATP-dependent DNA helicase RecG
VHVEIFGGISIDYVHFFRKKNTYSGADIFASIKKAFEPGAFVYVYGSAKAENCDIFIDVDSYETVKNEKDKSLLFNRVTPAYPST